jgi:hypothetical protein
MNDVFSPDLVHFFLITMPGFFFLLGFGYKAKSDFAFFMLSVFWGIILMGVVYNLIFSAERMVPLLNNIYAGSLTFSVVAYFAGLGIKALRPRFPIEF